VHFLDEADTLIVRPDLYEKAPLHQLADIGKHVLPGE
jgi:hypothetical protein